MQSKILPAKTIRQTYSRAGGWTYEHGMGVKIHKLSMQTRGSRKNKNIRRRDRHSREAVRTKTASYISHPTSVLQPPPTHPRIPLLICQLFPDPPRHEKHVFLPDPTDSRASDLEGLFDKYSLKTLAYASKGSSRGPPLPICLKEGTLA